MGKSFGVGIDQLRQFAANGNQDAIDQLAQLEQEQEQIKAQSRRSKFEQDVEKKLIARLTTYEANQRFQHMTRNRGRQSAVGQIITGAIAPTVANLAVRHVPTVARPFVRYAVANGSKMASKAITGTSSPVMEYNATLPVLEGSESKQSSALSNLFTGCLFVMLLFWIVVLVAVVRSGWFAALF